ELAVGRVRRLIPESLIGLNVNAHGHRVFPLGNGQCVFVLLDHIVAFHGAVVGIADRLVPLSELKGGEALVSRRKPLEIFDSKTFYESWRSGALGTGSNVHIPREPKADFIEHRGAESMAPTQGDVLAPISDPVVEAWEHAVSLLRSKRY